MIKMLTPTSKCSTSISCVIIIVLCAVSVNREVVAQVPNVAVPLDLLKEIRDWMDEGASEWDMVTWLRQRTVPFGYTPHNWQPGLYL